jgi:hypothetical protein
MVQRGFVSTKILRCTNECTQKKGTSLNTSNQIWTNGTIYRQIHLHFVFKNLCVEFGSKLYDMVHRYCAMVVFFFSLPWITLWPQGADQAGNPWATHVSGACTLPWPSEFLRWVWIKKFMIYQYIYVCIIIFWILELNVEFKAYGTSTPQR